MSFVSLGRNRTSTRCLSDSRSGTSFDATCGGRCRLSEASSEEVEEAGSPIVIVLPTAKRFSAIGNSAVPTMKHSSEKQPQEVLAGLVERVTYHNAENGFCVLRAKARGHRDVVTVVGHAATIAAGEWITASGEWLTTGHTASSSRRDSCAHRPQPRPTASKSTSHPA